MSNDLNRCEFIGRLGQDPEIRYMPNGDAVANISIACGESWKDKNTGEKQERTEWVRVSAFKKLAEIIGEYLHKGSQVYISGKMRTRKWQDKDGNDRYTTEIIADQMQMLDSRSGAQNDNQSPQEPANAVPEPQGGFDDSDIPFMRLRHEYCY